MDTPIHPDYLSGHGSYGGGAGGLLKKYFGTDKIDPPVSLTSNASIVGPITRSFKSIDLAVQENSNSRVFVGVHFQFASDEGLKQGFNAADEVWQAFKSGKKWL